MGKKLLSSFIAIVILIGVITAWNAFSGRNDLLGETTCACLPPTIYSNFFDEYKSNEIEITVDGKTTVYSKEEFLNFFPENNLNWERIKVREKDLGEKQKEFTLKFGKNAPKITFEQYENDYFHVKDMFDGYYFKSKELTKILKK